jgi:hypothetical protein
MFSQFDPNGNGYLSMAEVDKVIDLSATPNNTIHLYVTCNSNCSASTTPRFYFLIYPYSQLARDSYRSIRALSKRSIMLVRVVYYVVACCYWYCWNCTNYRQFQQATTFPASDNVAIICRFLYYVVACCLLLVFLVLPVTEWHAHLDVCVRVQGLHETYGLDGVYNCKPAIIRAFNAAKGLKKGKGYGLMLLLPCQ